MKDSAASSSSSSGSVEEIMTGVADAAAPSRIPSRTAAHEPPRPESAAWS